MLVLLKVLTKQCCGKTDKWVVDQRPTKGATLDQLLPLRKKDKRPSQPEIGFHPKKVGVLFSYKPLRTVEFISRLHFTPSTNFDWFN